MKKAMARARSPPTERTSDNLKAVAAEALLDEEGEGELELELELPEGLEPEVPLLLLVLPTVPLETAVPGRLTVALAARAWKASNEREALAVVLTLIAMVIPLWQCLAWEQ